MGTLLIAGLLGVCLVDDEKVLTPEQVENQRPEGEVTVAFLVETVGLRNGSIKRGDPPYRPISLETQAGLQDRRSKLSVVLVGQALTHIHNLGIGDPAGHFRERTIEAKGRVRYANFPRVTQPDGTVKVEPDNYPHYDIIIDSLDLVRVTE